MSDIASNQMHSEYPSTGTENTNNRYRPANSPFTLTTVTSNSSGVNYDGHSISANSEAYYNNSSTIEINGNTLSNTTSNNLSNASRDLSGLGNDVLFSGYKRKSFIDKQDNSIDVSKANYDLQNSLQSTIGSLNDFAIKQNTTLIDYVDVSKPMVLDSDNLELIFNDIDGTEYSYNIYYANDNTYFALSSYHINKPGNIAYNVDIGKQVKLFKLNQDIQHVSYFVYAFNDIPNNKITYNKYLGKIQYVDGVPMGSEIPKYENLIKQSSINPDTIEFKSYISSVKARISIDEKNKTYNLANNGYIGNIVLSEIKIPELDLIYDTAYKSYKLNGIGGLDTDYKLITRYDDGHIDLTGLKRDKNNNFVENLSHLITSYSLYSRQNIIKPQTEYVNGPTGRTLINKVKINPVTLFIPTLIYTEFDNNEFKYFPFDNVTDISDERIEIYCTSVDNKNAEICVNITIDPKTNITKHYKWSSGTNKIAVKNEKSDEYSSDCAKIEKIKNRDWIFVGNFNNKYSVYIKVNNVIQDKTLNYVEMDYNNSFDFSDIENNIVHIIVITPGDAYEQKINLKNYSVTVPLYTSNTIKVNDVSYVMLSNMSYFDYLSCMTTSYNLKYIDNIDFTYSWKFDPDESYINYYTDTLIQQESLSVTYSYWSPLNNSYINYPNKVLEYNGSFYGSDLFEDNIAVNNALDYKLIQVFKRTKLAYSSNHKLDKIPTYLTTTYATQSASFIKGNEEIKYQTYTNIPFELKNESSLKFTGNYSFVEPSLGYIINISDTTIPSESYIYNKGAYSYDSFFAYKISVKGATEGNQTTYYIAYKYSYTITYNDDNSKIIGYIDGSYLKDNGDTNDNITLGSVTLNRNDVRDVAKFEITNNKQNASTTIKLDENTSCTLSMNATIYYTGFSLTNTIDNNYVKTLPNLENYITETHDVTAYYDEINESGASDNNTCTLIKKTYEYDFSIPKKYSPTFSYSVSQVITTDGFWKPEYEEVVSPFVTAAYSFISNSVDVSNAYIVPTTKNERLGFVHNHKISYNRFVNSYVKNYKYTYTDDRNVQKNFFEDELHKIINIDDKYYGLTTSYYYHKDTNGVDQKRDITSLTELHRRLDITQEKQLEEVILQEEGYVPQNAQIDTPFGVVNGKKVIITDEIYVPETYTDIVSIDPITYEYFTEKVLVASAYHAYTYVIEDIPLITTTYIYNDTDGIKIQGMDSLVAALGGLTIGVSEDGASYTTFSSVNSAQTAESINNINKTFESHNRTLDKINTSLTTYVSKVSDSLVYINAAIDRTTKQIGYVANAIKPSENDSTFSLLSNVLSNNSSDKISSDKTNTSNLINAQKVMFNNLVQSIDNQTTTLSKALLLNSIGNSTYSGGEGSSVIGDLISSITDSIPKNWQSVERIGYTYSYDVLTNSYRSVPNKFGKIMKMSQQHYAKHTGTYNYETPQNVTSTYRDYIDRNISSHERIGLHFKQETRNFSYNGYLYKENYFSYENIADILADLHISNRLPTRKEFILDVSKRLYINSDFIFAYTSPNEYATRAIKRADILWEELVRANIIHDEQEKQRPLPEIPK